MIVLVNPWSTPSAKTPLPMSLLAIGSLLDGEYEYRIVDGNLDGNPVRTLLDQATLTPLTAIGVTVMPGPQLRHAITLSRAIKKALPGVPIIWGGYFPSQHADTCLLDPAVDIVVVGQGEHAFLDVIRAITRGGALSAIPGIAYRDAAGVQHTAPRTLVPLDELPDWPYARLPMERYFHRHYLGAKVATHHSSFGCPFACNFCAVVGIARRKWVAQSPERVAATLQRFVRDYGADAVQFHDMDFFISEARTVEFADRIRPLAMAWWALGRVDELMRYRDRTWEAMRSSGLKMVFCGAESGFSDTLRRMNKGGTARAELTLELAARMKTYGVVPEFSFVVGSPPDPTGDLSRTMAFIRKLKAINPHTEIILYSYSPVPLDGLLYDDARELGFRFPETLDQWLEDSWEAFSLRRETDMPWLNHALRRELRDFESVLNAYYPTVTDVRLTGWRRGVLRAFSAWRYWSEVYRLPVELAALQRIFHYRRPETTGF